MTMGKRVFVSYKYSDTNVKYIPHKDWWEPTKVRDYVDVLEDKIGKDNIYCGEHSNEDLSGYSEDYIWEHLKDKIFNTTVTVVLISPGMKEKNSYDKSQWIPWEIRYSIRENSRSITSHRNGIIAVVLPDINGSYSYMIEHLQCCQSGCKLLHTDKLFWILQNNMFNLKEPNKHVCGRGDTVYRGDCSYISMVTWDDFIKNADTINFFIEFAASKIKDADENYDLHLDINKV